MEYIYIGKIVNTHGIKGELRILSDFKYKDRIFRKGFNIYIGKDKIKETITSYRHHKVFEMICMDGYNDINEVLKYKGENVITVYAGEPSFAFEKLVVFSEDAKMKDSYFGPEESYVVK